LDFSRISKTWKKAMTLSDWKGTIYRFLAPDNGKEKLDHWIPGLNLCGKPWNLKFLEKTDGKDVELILPKALIGDLDFSVVISGCFGMDIAHEDLWYRFFNQCIAPCDSCRTSKSRLLPIVHYSAVLESKKIYQCQLSGFIDQEAQRRRAILGVSDKKNPYTWKLNAEKKRMLFRPVNDPKNHDKSQEEIESMLKLLHSRSYDFELSVYAGAIGGANSFATYLGVHGVAEFMSSAGMNGRQFLVSCQQLTPAEEKSGGEVLESKSRNRLGEVLGTELNDQMMDFLKKQKTDFKVPTKIIPGYLKSSSTGTSIGTLCEVINVITGQSANNFDEI
jgi:hypothetical protein